MEELKSPEKPAAFSRNVWYLGWVSFFNDLASEMIMPLLPLFMVNSLGLSRTFLGLIEGLAESSSSFLKVFSGWFSDKLGKRKALLYMGYGVSCVGKPVFAVVTSGLQALLLRWIDRLGKGIRTSPRDALIADSALENQRGKAFGFHRAMDTLGAVLGPLLGFSLLHYLGENFRLVFFCALFPGLVGLLFLRGVKESPTPPPSPEQKAGQGFKGDFKSLSREFKFFLLVTAVFSLGNSSFAFLFLRASQLGMKAELIPVLWAFSNLIYALSSLPFGHLSDKLGRKTVLFFGFLLFAATYYGFAGISKLEHLWLFFGFYGIYQGISDGVSRAYAADLAPGGLKAFGLGIYHFVLGIFLLPASLIAGLLWDKMGVAAPFYFGAVFSLLAGILLLFLPKKK